MTTPATDVPSLGPVLSVASGGLHSCALTQNLSNPVFCWGSNANARLGQPAAVLSSATPVAISGLRDAKALSVGTKFACAISGDAGNVFCWGYVHFTEARAPTQIRGISDAIAVSVGGSHVCAVVRSGRVLCWGENGNGQAGDGAIGVLTANAVTVDGISDATSVSAGYQHTCAVRRNGGIKCWGSNRQGQVGNGVADDVLASGASSTDERRPVDVVGIASAIAVSADFASTCALARDGSVYCWGDAVPRDGSVPTKPSGVWSATPRRVALAAPAVAVAAAPAGGCAVFADKQLSCWSDGGALLGLGDRVLSNRLPQIVAAASVGGTCRSQVCQDADAVFDWAEDQLVDALQAPRASSRLASGLYFRQYPSSGAYLGVTTTSPARLLYLGPLSSNQVLDLGELANWRSRAGP